MSYKIFEAIFCIITFGLGFLVGHFVEKSNYTPLGSEKDTKED